MKNKSLPLLYITFLLAASVAAWADGCVTANPATPIPASEGPSMGPPNNPNCLAQFCDGVMQTVGGTNCQSSGCLPGSCSGAVSANYCTGAPSAWTQYINTSIATTVNCWTGDPDSTPGDGYCFQSALSVTIHRCEITGTQPGSPLCYTTWYNSGGCGG